MLVEYVGPHDEVEVDGHPALVQHSAPVEVPDALAGRAPSGHPADEDYDPGEGLLAQPTNWRAADASQSDDEDDEDDESGDESGDATDPETTAADLAVVQDLAAGAHASDPPPAPSDVPSTAAPEEK